MTAIRYSLLVILIIGASLALTGCEGAPETAENFQWKPMFGDFTHEETQIIARVGGEAITQRMLELYVDELPPRLKTKYAGPDGQRLALKTMIDHSLMVQGAMAKKIYTDQDVARQLISQRRNTLDYAMRNYGLLRDNKPDENDMREFFNNNKTNYRQQGLVLSRHVECLTESDADLAYKRLLTGEFDNNFEHVVHEMSINNDTKKEGGLTGWFSRGGFVPYIRSGEDFSRLVYDMEDGLNAPVQVGDRWHVVEVTNREYERPQTFSEAKPKLLVDMLPAWQDAIIKDYLLSARKEYLVEMMGIYRPGQGATAAELLTRALNVKDPERQLELLSMIYTDYSDSGKADDALFMSANIAMERWQDVRVAARYLNLLITEFPDSELIEDAKFLLDNIGNPRVLNPESIDDLRGN